MDDLHRADRYQYVVCMRFVVYQIRIAAGVYVMELYVRTDWCSDGDGSICCAMAASTEAN